MWFKRHITGVADFRTRENRQPFWLWVLLVYGTQMVVGWIVGAVVIAGAVAQMVSLAQSSSNNPDAFKEHPEAIVQMMKPVIQSMMIVGAITAVITLVLLSAAVVRRLHDRNISGWWAAPVFGWHLASPIVAAIALPKMFDAMSKMQMGPGAQGNPGMAMMTGDLAWIQAVQWIGLLLTLVFVVFLALPGTAGANRYGPDPLGMDTTGL